jgi:hypothetical protein
VTDPANWDRVKALFHEALERAPAERASFVREACGDTPALQAEVESLLAAHERAGTVAEGSPLGARHSHEADVGSRRTLETGMGARRPPHRVCIEASK